MTGTTASCRFREKRKDSFRCESLFVVRIQFEHLLLKYLVLQLMFGFKVTGFLCVQVEEIYTKSVKAVTELEVTI